MRYKGNIGDFQSLGGGKKGHIGGKVIEGIDQNAFFQYQVGKSCSLSFDGAVNSGRAAADNDEVVHGKIVFA
jgi:hypothetical protein